MSATTLDFVQKECIEIAEALESLFTPHKMKRAAATILRNIVAVKPHCSFCGTAPNRWCALHPSPVKPNTWICDGCAIYNARLGNMSEREHERWLQLKSFAP
jgi:hypothetical protein